MRLANDNLSLTLGSRRFALRPTLRAAFSLEIQYEGLQNLCNAIIDGSLDACSDLIRATCTNAASCMEAIELLPLAELFATRAQLLLVVRRLAGDDPGSDKTAQEGEPIAFEEYYTRLFQTATGWLGWTPEQAWNATPAEIINAKIGRSDMLAAIFGNGKQAEHTVDIHDEDARVELNQLGDLSVTSTGAR